MPAVVVRAPSRLHFGLAAFGDPSVPQFGGVGAMVDRPRLVLRAERAGALRACGDDDERVMKFARLWWHRVGGAGEPQVKLTVERRVPAHVGLGSGTQLALSVAAAMSRLFGADAMRDGSEDLRPERIATVVGRGRRSAVGTYGFCLGGFLVDAGKTGNEPLGRLQCREAMPPTWRVALVRPQVAPGLSGNAEQKQFDRLPPVSHEVTRRLWETVHGEVLPAIRHADCRRFSEALYRYGVTAGNCFAPAQGGPFAGPRLAELVRQLRRWKVPGVGQSSWGPTVFAVIENEERAAWLARKLDDLPGLEPVIVTRFCNEGAKIAVGMGEPN